MSEGRRSNLSQPIGPVWRRVLTVSGVALVLSAVILVAYPYYPAVQYQIDSRWVWPKSAQAADQVSTVNRLYIPEIGVDAVILEGPTLDILNRAEGVWHQTGDPTSNVVLAGHRWKYLPPNTTTFYNLCKLAAGNTISIDWQGKRYIYSVDSVTTVPQDQIEILAPSSKPRLTLYTCNDKRQTERIVVTASLLP